MKPLFSLILALSLFVCTDVNAQTKFRPKTRGDVDLNQIFGVCGCTDCNGIPEHNNPVDDDFNGFVLGGRWTSTAMSGGGLGQGDPTMITWSVIPDGTDANGGGGFVPSNMIAFLDNIFNEANAGTPDLTNRIWWARMQQALDRWGEVAGVEYIYEPNDDGATNFGPAGIVGVRGDVRIGGFNIDGGGGTLAFNALPNDGDMAIDTADAGTFGNPQINFRLFRNIITHEQGHGIGIFHVVSNNANFLMEPFISGAFDGPQLDDVRAAQRHYGDALERSNNFQGNNSFANATPLGPLDVGDSVLLGQDGATGTVVSLFDDDFLSVDDNSDQDYFSFEVPDLAFVNITLTPVGASYNQSAEGGPGSTPTNPSTASNLTLTLFGPGGNLITSVNDTPAGEAEVIEDQIVAPGTYAVRATGSANTVQLYTIQIEIAEFVAPNSVPPTAISVTEGSVTGGTVGDLADSDDIYLQLIPGKTNAPSEAEAAALFTFITPDNQPSALSLAIELGGSSINVDRTISIFNTFAGMFEVLDSSEMSLDEEMLVLTPTGNPQSFVSFPAGTVLVDTKFEATGPTLVYPWTIRIDEFLLNTSQ